MAKQTVKENKSAVAHVRNLRISPRKMRLVTNLVKGMWAYDAITQLEYTNKKGARYVIDMIKSAIANADNNFKMDKDNLYVKTITCDAGPKIKRYKPRAQGRASEIRRPLAHIHVVLEERTSTKKRKARFADVARKVEIKPVATESTQKISDDTKKMISQIIKTEQQTKMNKVQNKRRLFNRKSGV